MGPPKPCATHTSPESLGITAPDQSGFKYDPSAGIADPVGSKLDSSASTVDPDQPKIKSDDKMSKRSN